MDTFIVTMVLMTTHDSTTPEVLDSICEAIKEYDRDLHIEKIKVE